MAARYVVQSTVDLRNGRTHTAYWCGPDMGWGTTYDTLDRAARFVSRDAAERKLRRVYGRIRSDHKIIREDRLPS
jgi:hypothetical protein